jgi:hypothetical protein
MLAISNATQEKENKGELVTLVPEWGTIRQFSP